MKLRHKITLTLIMTTALLSVVLISLFASWAKYDREKNIFENFTNKSYQLGLQFDQLFLNRINELNNIHFQIQKYNFKTDISKIEEHLFTARNNFKAYQNLAIISPNGIKLIDTNRIGLNKHYLINIDSQKFTDQNITYFYQKDQETNTEVITFYKKIIGKKNEMKGYLVANIPISSITNLIRNISNDINNEQAIEIFKNSGEIIFSTYRENKFDDNLPRSLVLFNNFYGNSINGQDDESFYTISKSAHINDLSPNNWYLIIREDKFSAYKTIHSQINILIAISVAFIIITFICSYLLANSLSKPLEKTSEAVVEAGKGNFELIQSLQVNNDEYGDLILTVQEMTKQVDMLIKEQAIKNRMTALGKMAGGIAHEINNPLHLINNHAIILNRTLTREDFHIKNELDKERIKKSLKSINETVHRISHIIAGLKSLTKDTNHDPMRATELTTILETTYALCKENISNHEINFKITSPVENIMIDCRSGQIHHVLLNLINNSIEAIKNLPEHKWIKIDIEIDDNIHFKVSNSGPKISEEVIRNLFTPFYTNKLEGKNSGLGLSIARQVIHAHHGQLYFDSTSENTTFIFWIPIKQNESKEETTKAA